jgi:Mono-functional DNA-alkylating methyl methanesulfonate N-term
LGPTTGIKGIWSLKASSMDAFDTYLVLTFVGETRVLAITPEDELDEAELAGFDAEAQVRTLPTATLLFVSASCCSVIVRARTAQLL